MNRRGNFGGTSGGPSMREGWDLVIPQQNGAVGSSFSVDLDDFWNGPTLPTYSLDSGSLPGGLSLGSTRNHILSGTPTTVETVTPTFKATVADTLEADWQARATAAVAAGGRAIRFNSSAEAIGTPATGDTNCYVNSASQSDFDSHIVWEQTIKRSGAGSLRFNVLSGDGADSGAFRWHVRPDYANIPNGGEYYIQWSQYFPSQFCFAVFAGTGSNSPYADGFKQIIASHYGTRIGANNWGAESGSEAGGSNNSEAVVVENIRQSGFPQVYYYSPGITQDATVTAFSDAACPSAALQYQNAINNTNITVTNCATVRQRYGPMYPLESINSGVPDSDNGGVVYVPGWMTFMLRIKIGNYDSANSIIELWGCVSGQVPRKMITTDVAKISIGNLSQGHGGFHLLPYNTAKSAGAGFDTFTCYTEVLTSIGANPINFPGGYSVTLR